MCVPFFVKQTTKNAIELVLYIYMKCDILKLIYNLIISGGFSNECHL